MEFVFSDKSKVEMDIITDVLYEEKIPYKIKKNIIKSIFSDEDEDEDFIIVEELYDIHCFTDLEHFDFIKHVAYKKIENRIHLERSYLKVRRKHVHRVSKKNSSDTNSKDRGK